MNRLRLNKNALNKKCALKKRMFQTDIRVDFLERIVRAFQGFTVSLYTFQSPRTCQRKQKHFSLSLFYVLKKKHKSYYNKSWWPTHREKDSQILLNQTKLELQHHLDQNELCRDKTIGKAQSKSNMIRYHENQKSVSLSVKHFYQDSQ